MKKEILARAKLIVMLLLPIAALSSAVITIQVIAGLFANEAAVQLGTSFFLIINSAYLLLNLYVKQEDMPDKSRLARIIGNRHFANFTLVSVVLFLLSLILFAVLK